MLRVIVNSTPLIALCNIGRLDLLQKVYSRIVIPQAVFDEATRGDGSLCALPFAWFIMSYSEPVWQHREPSLRV